MYPFWLTTGVNLCQSSEKPPDNIYNTQQHSDKVSKSTITSPWRLLISPFVPQAAFRICVEHIQSWGCRCMQTTLSKQSGNHANQYPMVKSWAFLEGDIENYWNALGAISKVKCWVLGNTRLSQGLRGHRLTLRWRHNDHDGVSNHQLHHCLLNCLFGRRTKKTPKLRVTGLCVGNSPETGELPAQMTSNAENVSIWRRHHEMTTSREDHALLRKIRRNSFLEASRIISELIRRTGCCVFVH